MTNRTLKWFLTFGIGAFLFSCQHEPKIAEGSVAAKKIPIAEIEAGIKDFIAAKTAENDGIFPVKDENHDLKMKLVRVHTEYLSNLGPKRHFACVDLVDESGDVYDVDFFMEGEPGTMTVTETTVHKLNGKPFYSWKQNKEDKTWYRVPLEQSNNSLLGVVEGKDSFEFYYSVQVPTLTGPAKMWIPIAKSDDFQEVKVLEMKVSGKSKNLDEKVNDNTILYLELGPEDSGKSIEISYAVNRKEKGPYEGITPDPKVYLASNILMPKGGRFEEIAKEALGPKIRDSHLIQARALYDYIIDNMRYMKFGDFGRGDSNYACDSKTGNCTEFHSFFISLARSVDIPSRFAIGASIPSDRNEGGIDGYHCWAEFYADGKWWPVDISEANKYTALATYYFGRHPANRIELSRGRDLQVSPGPASGPINFLAYPYLEIDGKEVKAQSTFSFQRKADS
ncbi:transglutaminase-like domain-containing protein [Algoriphagus sp.]|uniref:transglutaminase-like domain-containing protein n=1 Tax=Algoriphagus sp. TaxID=1872435 RepID=UPI00272399CE|nr:transglutaminase-like domain-containing protein [Algoriphagus sp.]MDO8967549.1 transglutaminase-like domain-containing protein [Algoriphagus sp.]MDP3199024.1 transglutaminase-like domain-containing protein [Algoriphagus sp.]